MPHILTAENFLHSPACPVLQQTTLTAGTGIELVLTFFLGFAIFGRVEDGSGPGPAWKAGAVLTVCVLLAYPLTGAALNPARWFGPCDTVVLVSHSRQLAGRLGVRQGTR